MSDELEQFDDDYSDEEDTQTAEASYEDIVVFSRDWTVETIISQISQGNIDLEPAFQRRNAWDDKRKSKLIESLIIGYPVPEIVLAEHPKIKKTFLVLDGKQRLLTLAGFVKPDRFVSWDNSYISGLTLCATLNGKGYAQLSSREKTSLENASLRCSIISNYGDEGILYDIFHRLNSGSVPLTTQELRQTLIRGEFSKYISKLTGEKCQLHDVMRLSGPDRRLRDVELLLRVISFHFFADSYNGNLKVFLDNCMEKLNSKWDRYSARVVDFYDTFNITIGELKSVFGGTHLKTGRKVNGNTWENRFNRALFEAEVLLFAEVPSSNVTNKNNKAFLKEFSKLCAKGTPFRSSIESSTKNIENYRIRYKGLKNVMEHVYNVDLSELYTFDAD